MANEKGSECASANSEARDFGKFTEMYLVLCVLFILISSVKQRGDAKAFSSPHSAFFLSSSFLNPAQKGYTRFVCLLLHFPQLFLQHSALSNLKSSVSAFIKFPNLLNTISASHPLPVTAVKICLSTTSYSAVRVWRSVVDRCLLSTLAG